MSKTKPSIDTISVESSRPILGSFTIPEDMSKPSPLLWLHTRVKIDLFPEPVQAGMPPAPWSGWNDLYRIELSRAAERHTFYCHLSLARSNADAEYPFSYALIVKTKP